MIVSEFAPSPPAVAGFPRRPFAVAEFGEFGYTTHTPNIKLDAAVAEFARIWSATIHHSECSIAPFELLECGWLYNAG